MKKEEKTPDASSCIHCGKCTGQCAFLTKYGIHIGNTARLDDLAYHCFLCGRCTEVCPIGIDGREVVLGMRKAKVRSNGGKLTEKGYGTLLVEKEDYLFKNYRNVSGSTVLFPGCNFPSFYPRTTRLLWETLRSCQDIGIIYDCCGKPVEELGKEQAAEQNIRRIGSSLKEAGVTEVIMVCPNCYYYLRPRLDVKVVSIYEKLAELGIGSPIKENDIHIFLPCPDREEQKWLQHMLPFLPTRYHPIEGVQCCGLGGCAAANEPDLAKEFLQTLAERDFPNIYTYCGTCGGNITRGGVGGVHHILAEILESKESADTKKSLLNRIKTKFH